ncbi:MAG: chemotaxis protein CheA [Planctomycetota bacterium]
MDEIINEFLVESYESLDRLDGDLLALEDAPDDRDRLASIFRTVHTIKGTSGFLALPKLERVAHVGENLLVPLRDGELRLNQEIADSLLEMVDAIRQILSSLEASGDEGGDDFATLVERLQNALHAEAAAEDASAETKSATEEDAGDDAIEPEQVAEAADVADESATPPETPTPAVAPEAKKENTPAAKAATKPASSGSEGSERSQSVADSTVRIDVCLLDRLMNLVGELVLARNQIVQFSSSAEDAAMIAASQRLNLVTTELQEGVMKTRMQPIRNAWNKLPRVVRDLSLSCGKKVDVQMEGADTELDKTILEAIKDPLTHIVRNSVDHGIEAPDVRVEAGKPETGVLLLRAFHEGGQVNIEIVDDGGGISSERVRAKAVEKGMVTPEQADSMTDRELTNLILLPGFSTAQQVTNVSGRGVGMDVVKTNIERIGGTLEIQSKPGNGTTLRIKIPLTLAIVPALIVTTGGEKYAIPQVSLLELVRLDGQRANDEIEHIHDVPVHRLRGNLLPLVYLDEQLGLRSPRQRHEPRESVNIVVLQAEDRQFGLVVDSITDTQEIVVKPLGQHLKAISAYAGATIMGDGTVSLILDVIGIAQKSSVLAEHRDRSLKNDRAAAATATEDTESLLLIDSAQGTRAAIRLSSVARLEEFAVSDIEQTGQSHVVQYRGQILPLISMDGHFGGFDSDPSQPTESIHTVVYNHNGESVGVVVGKIVDIVRHANSVSEESSGRSVIQQRVTEMVDLESLVSRSLASQGAW